MSKVSWMLIGAIIAVVAIYLIYNSQRTSRQEAGTEINQAVKATGDYLHDTAQEVKHDLQQ